MTLIYKLYIHSELHYTLFKELFQSKLKYKGMCEIPKWKLILLNYASERGHYHAIMCNETLIKVGKFKKTLNIMNRSWGKPIHNGLDLMRIHANATFRNNILEEFHFSLTKFAFLQLNIESNFFKRVQNKSNMSFTFLLVLGKNEDVIDVTNHEIIQVFIENIIHQMLKDDMGISEAKRHRHIFKITIMDQIICTT